MSYHLDRSTFLSASAAMLLLPRALGAQAMTTVRIGTTPQWAVSGALYAQADSSFQKSGINASIIPMNSGAQIIAAIVGGSLEFGNLSMLNLIEAHARNIPIVVEYAASIYSADVRNAIGIIVGKSSSVKSGSDLTGKILGVPALGDTFTISASAWIDKTGGNSASVKFLELPNAAAADAIESGRVDAAVLVQPTLQSAVAGGKCRIIADPFAAIAPRFVSTVYACSLDFATKNPSVVARFRKVVNDAGIYVNGHVPEILPLVAKFTGIDPAILQNIPMTPMGTIESIKEARTTIQPLIDVAAKYKAISRSFDARDMIDPAALT